MRVHWFEKNRYYEALKHLALLPWLMAASVAALSSQNLFAFSAATLAFFAFIFIISVVIALAIAALPRWLGRLLFVIALAVSVDSVIQALPALNGYLYDAAVPKAARVLIDGVAVLAALAGLISVPLVHLRALSWTTGGLVLASVIMFPQTAHLTGWADDVSRSGALGRVVVHLILDEHTGISPLQAHRSPNSNLADDLQEFYLANGFRIFPNAYSHFNYTDFSLPSLLSLENSSPAGVGTEILLSRWTQPFKWFQTLNQDGYRLHVFSVGASWNLCTEALHSIAASCTIAGDQAVVSDPRFLIPLRFSQAFAQNFTALASRSPLLSMPADILGLKTLLRGQGPAHSVMVMERIAEEISSASGDAAWFAHLWIPHQPMVVDEYCKPRVPPPNGEGSAWAAYEKQISCARKGISAIIEALRARNALGRATIIIQGDHGLRPASSPYNRDKWDLISHSALFVVRQPGIRRGLSNCPYSIQSLLPATVFGGAPRAGDAKVMGVVDPGFWLKTEGARRPKVQLIHLNIATTNCSPDTRFPGLIHPTRAR